MTCVERVKSVLKSKNISFHKAEKDLEFGNGYFANLRGETIKADRLQKIADYLNVSSEYLLNGKEKNAPGITDDVETFSILGEVAAGYEHIASADWAGERIDIPRQYLRGRSTEDYFVLRVCGNSMYPMYMDGDIVLVLRQSTMNRSGEIGVVVYDDEKATLKKIEYVYGENWMKLIPINPQYPPITISGESLEHCHVLGMPKLLIRNIEP